MSKTVSELSAELGVSKQYLNRVLSQNNLGRKIGNVKEVMEIRLRSKLKSVLIVQYLKILYNRNRSQLRC